MKTSEQIIREYIMNPPMSPDNVEESTVFAASYSAQLAFLLSARQALLLFKSIDDEGVEGSIQEIIETLDRLIKEYSS